jgi:hypothetical protein
MLKTSTTESFNILREIRDYTIILSDEEMIFAIGKHSLGMIN